jgi:hypothetical protein
MLAVFGQRKVEPADALAVLRYGSALRTLAFLLAFLPPLIAIYVIWVFPWKSQLTLNVAGISFLLLGVLSALLLIEVTCVQVVVSDDSLTRFSPWAKPVTLKWVEVQRISYSSLNRWFIVEGFGRTVRVSRHLVGIGIFAETVRRKLAVERWLGAATVLEQFV